MIDADRAGAQSNWGRWGPEDERGAANLLTPETVLSAVRSIRSGEVLSLAQPLDSRTPVPHGRPEMAHAMLRDGGDYAIGRRLLGRSRFSDDLIVLATHVGTHIDSLAHVWYGEELYNGFEQSAVGSSGARRCGIDKLGPLVARGVLFDVAGHLGVPALERATAIDGEMLDAVCRAQELELRPGDVVILRTGWLERHGEDPAAYFGGEPGLVLDGARWLAERDVTAVGCDNYAVERLEARIADGFPVHELLLRDHGIPLMEGLVLGEVARRRARDFLFIAAPLPIRGGTAGPVSPVAVL